MRYIIDAIGCYCLLAAVSVVSNVNAATSTETILIQSTFDDVADGQLPSGPQPGGTIGKWEGAADEHMGVIGASENATADGHGKSIEISNVAHKPNRSPGLLLNWPASTSGVLSIEYKFMIPVEGPYLSVCYVGGDWKSGATILMAGNGKLTVQYGEDDARIDLGAYEAHHWYTVRFDLNVAARTVNVFLDGKKKLNQLPWQPGAASVSKMSLFADFNLTDHGGEPVLYVDDVTVKTLAASE